MIDEKMVDVNIDDDLYETVSNIAKQQNKDVTEFINEAIEKGIEKRKSE